MNLQISSLPNTNKLKDEENIVFSKFKKLALTELVNLGNPSYLNSVLQLVCNIRSFVTYFLNAKNGDYFKNDIRKYPLSYVIHRLCTHIYPDSKAENRQIYNPVNVRII